MHISYNPKYVLTYNVQWKWLTGTSVPTYACNCGSIVWGSCTKAQRGNQAILASVIADYSCSKLSCGGGTCVVHGLLSKCFISPEKSVSLTSTCEGDFLWGTSISSRDTASQYQTYRIVNTCNIIECKPSISYVMQSCNKQRFWVLPCCQLSYRCKTACTLTVD